MLPYPQEDVIHSWVRLVPRLTFRRQTVLFSTLANQIKMPPVLLHHRRRVTGLQSNPHPSLTGYHMGNL